MPVSTPTVPPVNLRPRLLLNGGLAVVLVAVGAWFVLRRDA